MTDDDDLFPQGKPTTRKEIDRIFDQYKLAVDMWDRVRARRQLSNSFYLSINSAIIGAAALSPPKFSSHALYVVGIIICILWIASLLSYRSLTEDKYRVITELEKLLPSSPFSAESKPRRFTRIERCIPIAFTVFYAILIALTFFYPTLLTKT